MKHFISEITTADKQQVIELINDFVVKKSNDETIPEVERSSWLSIVAKDIIGGVSVYIPTTQQMETLKLFLGEFSYTLSSNRPFTLPIPKK